MVSIARILQNQGKNDECYQYCAKIIKLDPSNEDATYMQANIQLMREQNSNAV